VSAGTNEPVDPSCRYWKAAIATLPPAKRDAAWQFYATHLADGQTGDTLSGLILLLEANGAFLLTLPGQFHGQLIQPLAERLEALRDELLAHVERQQTALIEYDRVQEAVSGVATLIQEANREFIRTLQSGIGAVDIAGLTSRINHSLETNTLRPIQVALRNLDKHAENADRVSVAAERSIRSWRRVHITGIAGTSFLAALLFAGLVLSWGWWNMEARFRQRLAAQVVRLSATDDAYRQLLWLGISLRLEPWLDESGKAVEDGYCVVVADAESADLKVVGDRKLGMIALKATPLLKRIEMLKHEVDRAKK
jgi:hypothetical protein